MFGASLAGLVVNLGFARGVAAMQDVHDAALLRLFESPQVLLRAADQQTLLSLAQGLHVDAVRLLAEARAGLVSGIHAAFFGCLVVALASYVVSRRLPAFARAGGPG
jgi:hypothetical protein